jgi:hypothetical protein
MRSSSFLLACAAVCALACLSVAAMPTERSLFEPLSQRHQQQVAVNELGDAPPATAKAFIHQSFINFVQVDPQAIVLAAASWILFRSVPFSLALMIVWVVPPALQGIVNSILVSDLTNLPLPDETIKIVGGHVDLSNIVLKNVVFDAQEVGLVAPNQVTIDFTNFSGELDLNWEYHGPFGQSGDERGLRAERVRGCSCCRSHPILI